MQLAYYGFRQNGRPGEGSRACREGGKCEMPMSRSRRKEDMWQLRKAVQL